MIIMHRIEKTHQNVDDLSRLPAKTKTDKPSNERLKTNNLSNVVIANDENLLKKNRE